MTEPIRKSYRRLEENIILVHIEKSGQTPESLNSRQISSYFTKSNLLLAIKSFAELITQSIPLKLFHEITNVFNVFSRNDYG